MNKYKIKLITPNGKRVCIVQAQTMPAAWEAAEAKHGFQSDGAELFEPGSGKPIVGPVESE